LQVNLRGRASANGISLRQIIPFSHNQDRGELEQRKLSLTDKEDAVRFNEEGWLYVYSQGDTCLYVGKTGKLALMRACEHINDKNDFGRYLRHLRDINQPWKLQLILPSDCEQLIRKSFLLPSESNEIRMSKLEEKYQEKRRSDPDWWLRRAEWVTITIFEPVFNQQGKRQNHKTTIAQQNENC